MEIQALKKSFEAVYGKSDLAPSVYFAPGRVNLIGEHTDYNGGHVLPCALSNGTYMVVRKRDDRTIRLYSENFKDLGVLTQPIERQYDKTEDWTDYIKGVLHVLASRGMVPEFGFDAYVYGNIPNGAGLSSSASLELVTLVALQGMNGFTIEPITRVHIARAAENEFVGVNCGIMDQFIIGMGKANHAILLNTESLAYEYAPIQLTDHVLVIANTNKRRGLADSKYNERFNECHEALKRIQGAGGSIKSLGGLSLEALEAFKEAIGDPVLYRRARHTVSENLRTIAAHKALSAGNLDEFGQLMNASHLSLKEDYEVTGLELDTLVALAQAQAGVLGARMTGAGFGGCTVSLVERQAVDHFIASVGSAYEAKIGYKADFYSVTVGDGAKELR